MKNRFEGEDGRRLLVDELLRQKIVQGELKIAEELLTQSDLIELEADEQLIEQNAEDTDIYFILSGSCRIVVNGKKINIRHAGEHVGEMVAIDPGLSRTASVYAESKTVLLKISEPNLSEVAKRNPVIWRRFAKELAKRLEQRNILISKPNEVTRVFIISSSEAKPIAQIIQEKFEGENFEIKIWTDDVFKICNYTIEDLEREIEKSDFAVAIASGDDIVESRGSTWPAPRDNVIFELGLFMGRLGRKRAILMEPRGEGVKVPSDHAGMTTIPYRYKSGPDNEHLMGAAINKLRKHISTLGRRD